MGDEAGPAAFRKATPSTVTTLCAVRPWNHVRQALAS